MDRAAPSAPTTEGRYIPISCQRDHYYPPAQSPGDPRVGGGTMKVGLGMVLGIVGGLLTLIGAVLPWATVSGGTLTSPLVFTGYGVGFGGVLVLVFGVLGLICVAIPKKVTAILALIWGILALLFALLTVVGLAALAQSAGGFRVSVTTEEG